MMEYKRFTEKVDSGFVDELDCRIAYNKLVAIEDKIEQGTLIELPCKVGDTVYFPVYESRWDCAEIDHIHITDKEIIFEWVQYDRGYELTEVWDDGEFTLDDIGKTVFITREEAEANLQGVGGREVMKQVYKCEYCEFMEQGDVVSEHEKKCLYNPENKGCANCRYGVERGLLMNTEGTLHKNFNCLYNKDSNSVGMRATDGTPCEHYRQGECMKIIPM